MSNYLLDEYPLLVFPKLAATIGLNEAIILQQIRYWLEKSDQNINGHKWVYNTVEQWKEQFPFWSSDTVRRGLANLKSKGILIGETLSPDKRDRTMYYRIDYGVFDRIMQDSKLQSWENGKLQPPKIANCNHVTTTETTTETTTDSNSLPESKKKSSNPQFFEGVDPQVVADFLAIRKAKKSPVTETAVNGIKREAEKLNYTLEQALRICCERGWAGFKADWILREEAQKSIPIRGHLPNKQESIHAQNLAVAATWVPPELREKNNAS